MRYVESMRWTIVLSVLLGAVASWAITPWAWYDALFPVVSMEAQVMQKTPAEVLVSLGGKKHRDCRYGGISAYSQHGQLLKELNIDRADQPPTGSTHPKGTFNFGTWRIWPTTDTKTVLVYVEYDCDGRQVFVRAAEVAL